MALRETDWNEQSGEIAGVGSLHSSRADLFRLGTRLFNIHHRSQCQNQFLVVLFAYKVGHRFDYAFGRFWEHDVCMHGLRLWLDAWFKQD